MTDPARPADGVHVEVLGAAKPPAASGRALLGEAGLPTHALVNVTIEPGKPLPEGYTYTSLVLRVNKGRLEVVTTGGHATVTVGHGKPVRPGPRQKPFCEAGTCELPAGQKVVLEPGNSLSLTGGEVSATAVSDRTAEVQMSLVLPDLGEHLCWICPPIVSMY